MFSKIQGSEGYGQRDPACALTEEESALIDLSLIKEDKLVNKQIKLMVGFGALLGFCGSDEHTYMMFHQIGSGFFPADHPLFPGTEWWGLTCFLQDKANHLSSSNDFVRQEQDALGKFPVLSDGIHGDVKNDFGGAIKRYVESFPVPERKGCFYRKVNRSGTGFTKKQVVGKESVTIMIRQGLKMFGIKHWEIICPHALRGHFASILANNPSVNLAESLKACRHKSAKTNEKYQQTGTKSECNKILALMPTISTASTSAGVTNNKSSPEPKQPTITITEPTPTKPPAAVEVVHEEPTDTYVQMTQTMQNIPIPDESPSTYVAPSTSSRMPSPEFASSSTSPGFASSSSATSISNTQVQINGLYQDIARVEELRRRNANITIQNMRSQMSQRERDVRELRRTVQSLEHQLRLTSLPYANDFEETESLINQSIAHDMEEAQRERRRRSYDEYARRYHKKTRRSW